MNQLRRTNHRLRFWLGLSVLVIMLAAATFFAISQRPPEGPRLLNEPTQAREVRPFSSEPDPRFDPLPIEPEKHGK
jgi:hypothetical protein